jgi:hypothetical protein
VINNGVWRVSPTKPDESGVQADPRGPRRGTGIVLPPGSYVVHVALGLVSATRAATLEIRNRSRVRCVAGRRSAHRGPGRHQQIPPDFIRALGQPVRAAERASLVPNFATGDVAVAGRHYHIISNSAMPIR